MPKKIVFFNYYHNGDIHLSRGLIRQIMNKVHSIDSTVQFSYGHKNDPSLLSDIADLAFDPTALSVVKNDHANLHVVGDTTYINTWYGQQHFKYINRYGISLSTLYSALNDSCKSLWDFSLSDISVDPSIFFPHIDYSKYQISNAKQWLQNNLQYKILIENGLALSDQAHNFDMTSVIINLAQKHPEITFILSEPSSLDVPKNIIYCSDVIRKSTRPDLNEISFLSTQCNMIIGRASGVFSFATTQDNFLKREIKILCFSNLVSNKPNKFWLGELLEDQIDYKANIIVSNESNIDIVQNMIEEQL